jgi:hypothetical protein
VAETIGTAVHGYYFSFLFFFFFWRYWGLNSGFCACLAGALTPENNPQPFFALVIFLMGSHAFAQASLRPWYFLPMDFHIAGIRDTNQPAWFVD